MTPGQQHRGEDKAILKHWHTVYQPAKVAHPERWSRQTRNWQRIDTATLNPEREKQNA